MRKSFLDDKYRPTGESVLKESKISLACGIFCVIVLGIMIWLSFRLEGNAGRFLGFVGWLLLLLAGGGEYYAVIGLKQPGGKFNAKILGAFLNGIIILIMIFIFFGGIF